MNSDWARVRELFELAEHVPKPDRDDWLAEQCAGDGALQTRVAKLLRAADDVAADATGEIALDTTIPADLLIDLEQELPGSALIGRTIGGFRTMALLGAGGMGVVLRAEQDQPHREVALKVLAGPLVGESARRRFEYEGEVLGQLQHAHIAQVFATGSEQDATSGQLLSWIAMELVTDAEPLDRYATSRQLNERQRLGLMLDLCDAVAHGHRRGVLHRDLKPGNVLVRSDGTVKVIDFGIARAVDPDGGEEARTLVGQVLGTPRYMSPEQLAGDRSAIDTRTDVYALGVLLFELLTGQPPRDYPGGSLATFAQRVASEDPPKPSSRTADVAADLDWICMRALAIDAAARYASVDELAADIRRYLASKPVLAGPPSALYTLRRFVRRHRTLVGVVAASAVLLLATAVVATLGWWRAAQSAALARSEAETQNTVVHWLSELLQSARADRQGKNVLVADLLAAGEERLGELQQSPVEVEATLRNVMAQTWMSLDQDERALAIVEQGMQRLRSELPEQHSDYGEACYLLGLGLAAIGKYEDARARLDEALRLRMAHLGDDSVETGHVYHALAVNEVRLGRGEEAATLFARAQAIFTERLGPGDARTLQTISDRVDTAHQLDHYDEVRADLLAARDLALAELGTSHPVTLGLVLSAANDDRNRGDREAAENGYRQALALARDIYGEHSAKARMVLGNLAVVQQDRGDLDGAVLAFEQLVAAHEAAADDPLQALIARNNLASVLLRADRPEPSRAQYDALLTAAEGMIPSDHWLYATFLRGRGAALTQLGALAEAEADLQRSVEVFATALGDDNPRTQKALESIVALYEAWQKPEQAAEFRRRLTTRD